MWICSLLLFFFCFVLVHIEIKCAMSWCLGYKWIKLNFVKFHCNSPVIWTTIWHWKRAFQTATNHLFCPKDDIQDASKWFLSESLLLLNWIDVGSPFTNYNRTLFFYGYWLYSTSSSLPFWLSGYIFSLEFCVLATYIRYPLSFHSAISIRPVLKIKIHKFILKKKLKKRKKEKKLWRMLKIPKTMCMRTAIWNRLVHLTK